MPATVARRPRDRASVDIVRGFLDSAIYFQLLDVWLEGFIGELQAGTDPVDAAATSAEEWDFGGFIGALGSQTNELRLQTAFMNARGQLTIPREVRDHLNLVAGDRVQFVRTVDGQYVMCPALRQ